MTAAQSCKAMAAMESAMREKTWDATCRNHEILGKISLLTIVSCGASARRLREMIKPPRVSDPTSPCPPPPEGRRGNAVGTNLALPLLPAGEERAGNITCRSPPYVRPTREYAGTR